jgi:hypothetical protein
MGWLTALREEVYPGHPFASLPAGPGFSLDAARTLAWAAQLAYEAADADKFQRILGRWAWRDPRVLTGRYAGPRMPLVGTKGFVATTPEGAAVLAFAGTEPESLRNWITNFAILRAADGVHSGFLAGVAAVWPDLRAAVAEHAAATGDLYLTGHSLGGALAVVAARRLLEEGVVAPERLRGVYALGMPRPGDEAYARGYVAAGGGLLGQRTFRLVYGEDLVPTVPPAVQRFGFRHVGRVLACARGGRFSGTPQGPLLEAPPAAGEGVLTVLDDLLDAATARPDDAARQPPFPSPFPLVPDLVERLPSPIRDHLPDRYLAALAADAPGAGGGG